MPLFLLPRLEMPLNWLKNLRIARTGLYLYKEFAMALKYRI
jgi:hypothetical protein